MPAFSITSGPTSSDLSGRSFGPLRHAGPSPAGSVVAWFAKVSPAVWAELSEVERLQVAALDSETDSDLKGRACLSLAAHWEQSLKLDAAWVLYRFLSSHPNGQSPGSHDWGRTVEVRARAIQGEGPLGTRAEHLTKRLARDATNPNLILPMMVGTAVFGVVRNAALGRLLASPQVGLWRRGIGARFAAGALGYAAEVPAFVASGRLLRALGNVSEIPDSSWSREVAGAGITLGVLKFVGAGSQAFLAKTGLAHRSASSFAVSQTALFLGLSAAHRLEAAWGLRPSLSGETLAVDTLAAMFSLGVGASLGRRILGRPWERLSLGLEARLQEIPSGGPNSRRPALAQLTPLPVSGSGGGRSAPREPADFLKPMEMSGRERQKFEEDLRELRTNPSGPSPERRLDFEAGLNSFGENRANRIAHAALALRDFTMMRVLALDLLRPIPTDSLDSTYGRGWDNFIALHLMVKNYPAAFEMAEHRFAEHEFVTALRRRGGEVIFENNVVQEIPIRDAYAFDYSERKGFDKKYFFDLGPTLRDIVTLSREYDVFVGVARGGLYSASVADLLGLPNLVMEVHAHGRRKATSRWVDSVSPEQIAGKRVLLLDKDAVTGATIAEALRLLEPMKPAQVGVYFNFAPRKAEQIPLGGGGGYGLGFRFVPVQSIPELLPRKALRRIEGLGVAVHHPDNVPRTPLLAAFDSAHERLGTQLGRVRRLQPAFQDGILAAAKEVAPTVAAELVRHWYLAMRQYDALNPWLPGSAKVGDSILSFLEASVRDFQAAIDMGVRDPHAPETYEHFSGMLAQARGREEWAEDLAQARYQPWGQRLARERGIPLEHIPHAYTPAFRKAQEALREGNYEVALIVGPEGFAYEPIFRDLGIPTVAVNIPEADFGGRRSLKKLDALEALRGKRVLVVEDDVRSGATLNRLLRGIKPYGPFAALGLYLGLPQVRQMRENIPKAFQRVFVSDSAPGQDRAAFMDHFSLREKIFKESDSR